MDLDPRPAASEDRPGRKLRFALASGLVCTAVLALFFRHFLYSHFDQVAGDLGDNRFVIAILEHWRAVARGQASFPSPNFFWPIRGALGYSESLFLLALPYELARSTGADPYLSFEIALVIGKAVGFFSMLWLMRSVIGVSRSVALFSAALFTLSNLYYISIRHSQLIAVALLPLLSGFAVRSWRQQSPSRHSAPLYACAAGVILALILFTSYYIGWFAVLSGLTVLGVTLCSEIAVNRSLSPCRAWFLHIRERRRELLAAALAFFVALGPFLVTYLPVWKRIGGRTFFEVLNYVPAPADVLNLGPDNWLWSGALQRFVPAMAERAAIEEMRIGWPPFSLAFFLAGAVVSLVGAARNCRRGELPRGRFTALAAVLSASCLALWALCLRLGDQTLWQFVFRLVPGASGIRVPARLSYVWSLPAIIVVSLSLERFVRANRRRSGAFAAFACCAVLLAEQANSYPTHQISRKSEDRLLGRIEAPPAGCASFVATRPAAAGREFFAHQIDAMLLARRHNLPTVNGYSGSVPDGWNLMFVDNQYLDHVRSWARGNNITEGLCGCDLLTGKWSHLEVTRAASYSLGSIIDFRAGGNAGQFLAGGWATSDPGGAWTLGPRSTLMLELAEQPHRDLWLQLEMRPFTPPSRPRFTESLVVNGATVAEWSLSAREPGRRREVRVPLQLLTSTLVRIELVNHDPRSPAQLGVSIDTRPVGVSLSELRLSARE